MKGIVADIKGRYAVVLAGDGSFIKVRNRGSYAVGCEINYEKPAGVNVRMLARVSSLAAGALLVLGIGCGAYSYTMPYSFVDVDINPSIELTTNIYDRIIKTEALNEDGRKLLQAGSLKNSELEEGVAAILNNAVQQGYLKEGAAGNTVLVTVVSKNDTKSDQLKKGLQAAAASKLEKEGVETKLVVEKASSQERDNARKAGLTPGKLNLIEKAVKAEPGLKPEDLKNAPLKNIMDKIKESKQNSGQEKRQGKQEKQENPGIQGSQPMQGAKDAENSRIKQKIQDVRDKAKNRQDRPESGQGGWKGKKSMDADSADNSKNADKDNEKRGRVTNERSAASGDNGVNRTDKNEKQSKKERGGKSETKDRPQKDMGRMNKK